MKRTRLDVLLVERGLAESREKAQRLVLAGEVLVDDAPAAKPGHEVPSDCLLRVRQPERFVGRGGLKLEEAFVRFPLLTAADKICVDVGASTGGFIDCLLQHGAAKVYAIDVGKSQLHSRLVADPCVVALDGCNARHLQAGDLPELHHEDEPLGFWRIMPPTGEGRALPVVDLVVPDTEATTWWRELVAAGAAPAGVCGRHTANASAGASVASAENDTAPTSASASLPLTSRL